MTAYFLSDIHLGAPYFPDSREAERRVVAFLDGIKKDADVIYLLGDILDYWYEYRYVVPRGFVRFFGKLAELADMGIRIVWFIGNHDIWIFDYLPSELGIEVVDGSLVEEIDGRRFFMTHGDGIGRLKPSFKLAAPALPQQMVPEGVLRHTSALDSAIRLQLERPQPQDRLSPSEADADRMMDNIRTFSREYLAEHPDTDYFIYGHLHLLERFRITANPAKGKDEANAEVIVLGEWLSRFSYARWNGTELELKLYRPEDAGQNGSSDASASVLSRSID